MDFEAARGLSPNHVPAIIGKINCLFFQNDVKDALKLIKKTIKKFPDNANLYYHSGMIYNTKKKYKKSINYFNIALDKETNADNTYRAKS